MVPERSRWAKVARPVLKQRYITVMWTSTLTDRKTDGDGSFGSMHDKCQFIEEPCEVKVSRTVLKTSGTREGIA